jgi:hypothetical protein
MRFDELDGTTHWQDGIAKEMKNPRIAFEFNNKHVVPIVGHKQVRCHWVCQTGCKWQQYRNSKGHRLSSIVSRDSVRIFFLLAALNNAEILSCDIQNAYLTGAKTKETIWMRVDTTFGADKGRPTKIVQALHCMA